MTTDVCGYCGGIDQLGIGTIVHAIDCQSHVIGATVAAAVAAERARLIAAAEAVPYTPAHQSSSDWNVGARAMRSAILAAIRSGASPAAPEPDPGAGR